MPETNLYDWRKIVQAKLRRFRLPPEREIEIADEVAQCLEERFQEERERGMAADAAYARVAREFEAADFLPGEIARAIQPARAGAMMNDREAVLGASRGGRGWTVLHDARYALRALAHNKAFALAAVLTLALGIGANTAVFSVVNGVLLRPLPFEEPERLTWWWGRFHANDSASVSPPDFLDYRAQAKSFASMGASIGFGFTYNLTGEGEPLRLTGAPVSAGYFETLGARPILGRTFRAEEERAGNETVVILSHRLWQERFGGDRGVIGRALALNGRSHTVIGVMGPEFDYPQESRLWTPIPFGHEETSVRRFHFLRPVGRLRDGVTIEQAQAELDTIAAQLERQYPESNTTWSIRLEPLRSVLVGSVEQPLLLLWAAVGFVLVIACANVANLLLARGEARQKEIAIRKALGASRRRIVAQLLTESVLLALAGAAGGLALAYAGVALLQDLAPNFLPRVEQVGIDFRVFGFAMGAALVTGCVAGIVPALHAMRVDSHAAMREGARGAGAGRLRTHRALVVAEIAISLVLLIGAGLVVKSYWRLSNVPLGFVPGNALTTSLRPAGEYYDVEENRRRFFREAIEKARALPGVKAVGAISMLPMRGFTDTYFAIEGRPPAREADRQGAQSRTVAGDYFAAMQIATVKGRVFGAQDTEEGPRAVVVNEAFARRFFPEEEPLGKILVLDFGEPYRAEIIGVVASARQALALEPRPEFYVWHEQRPAYSQSLVLRTEGDAASLAGAVRQAVWEVDRNQTFSEFMTMETAVSRAAGLQRFNAVALGIFAGLALVLAVVGTYGVLAYAVSRRTHEIGIRVALGALPGHLLRSVLRQGLTLAVAGVLLGLCGGWWLTSAMSSLLFEVSPRDRLSFSVAPVVLLAAAFVACWVPARRATRVDPITALRHE